MKELRKSCTLYFLKFPNIPKLFILKYANIPKVILKDQGLGTIFTAIADNSPNVNHFFFILDENTPKLCAKQGMFIYTISEEGMLVGKIEEISVRNDYYEKPQTVKKFDSGSSYGIKNYFPTDKWEDYIGSAKILGVFPFEKDSSIYDSEPSFNDHIERPAFPAKPGNKVFMLDQGRLRNFLGLDIDGLNFGALEHYNIDVRLNISRLINKHFAVLAMSGAGKSYLISVLLEELLLRDNKMGTPGILLIDVHGEYKFFSDQGISKNKNFAMKTTYYNAKYFQIDVSTLNAYDIGNYQPNISKPQIRELKKIIDHLQGQKNEEGNKLLYDLNDIISELENHQEINQKVKETLIGWLFELKRLNLFSNNENPTLRKLILPGRLSILDLSSIISLKKKQIIVGYLAKKLLFLRRIGKIPPFLIILEESHQFCGEGNVGGYNISKRIIETIAREGRKFYGQICLISQRPVKLSTTALSQCNTHFILRVTNPNDLDHIRTSCEALTRESLRMISTLPIGTALILGEAVNIPIFVKIRNRYCLDPYDDDNLENVCKKFT